MLFAALVSASWIVAQEPGAPVAEPVPEPVAEGPAAAPAAPAPAPAVAAPAAPKFRGIGLAIGAGITGGVGFAMHMSRIAIVQTACTASGDVGQSVQNCVGDLGSYLALSAVAPLFNIAAIGLAGGAGSIAGRYETWKTAYGGGRPKVGPAYVGVGAGLFAAGFIAYLATRVMLWRDVYGTVGCAAKGDISDDCVRGRWSGWLAGIGLSQASMVVGTGLLSFGTSYIRYKNRPTALRMSVDPILAPTYAGLGLRGRF